MKVTLGEVAICVVIAAVVAAVLRPVFEVNDRGSAPAWVCRSQLKRLSMGMILYAGDHNDRLPARDAWMDGIEGYGHVRSSLHCPEASGYGYAFNASLRRWENDAAKPMIYDSVNPIRNASDPFASLPAVPRHWLRQNFVGYSDGHVKGSGLKSGVRMLGPSPRSALGSQ